MRHRGDGGPTGILLALSTARLASEGQQTKMEMIYRYLTGPRFRHRIEAVVERFTEMQADLTVNVRR